MIIGILALLVLMVCLGTIIRHRPRTFIAGLAVIAGLIELGAKLPDQPRNLTPADVTPECIKWGEVAQIAAKNRDKGVDEDDTDTQFLRYANDRNWDHDDRITGLKYISTVYHSPVFRNGAPETNQHVAEYMCMEAQ